MHCGTLFILSSPSGAGKSSLLRALLERHNDQGRLKLSVSHTTRAPRPKEQDGVDYHFTTQEQFMELVAQDAFYEWAQVFDRHYGTHQGNIDGMLSQGHDVLLDIDWQGARQVRTKAQRVVSVFILPPSVETLSKRLNERGQDDAAVIASRMQRARDEISHFDEFDYIIVNDDFEQALGELQAIITAQRLLIGNQRQQQQHLIENLMADKGNTIV